MSAVPATARAGRGLWDRFQNPCRSLLLLVLTLSCGGTRHDFVPEDLVAHVDFSTPRQHISGFGASSAWTLHDPSADLADQLFSADTGIGLSLLRLRIAPNGTTAELRTAQAALARGAQVWAAPWSPPAEWKSNGKAENGGTLLPEHRGDWAARLVRFVTNLSNQGVPLLYLSAQNEPGWVAEWETCEWTPEDLNAFIRDELGPRLADTGLATRVMAPESNSWARLPSFTSALLADATTKRFLGPIASHAYGTHTPRTYPQVPGDEHELWQTEISDDGPGTVRDLGMGSALRVATMIHEHLVVAGVNAWHYWWIKGTEQAEAGGNPALTDHEILTRRAYVLGNYSRFVRPGFVRVEATPMPLPGVRVSAFRDPASERIAIVVINTNSLDTTLEIAWSGTSAKRVAPFVTSETAALEPATAIDVVPNENRFTATLAARSVTTFTGAD